MHTHTPPDFEAGAIVRLPDGSRGWVHLEEYCGMICCYRTVDLGNHRHELALYTPDALTLLYPPPLPWNEGRHAFEVRCDTPPRRDTMRLSKLLGVLHIAVRDTQRPGYWLLSPTISVWTPRNG